MRPTPLLVALLVALLAPAAVHGQGNPATFSIDLKAGGPTEVDPGTVHQAILTVRFEGSGFACATDAAVPVNVTVDAGQAAEGVILEAPSNLTLTLTQGAYAPTAPFSAEEAVAGRLLVARYAAQGATSAFTVRVEADPAAAEGCTTEGADPVTAEAAYQVRTTRFDAGDARHHPDHEAHGDATFDAYLRPGESFDFTFEEPGRFPYHDHLTPERKGLIRVLRYAEGETNGSVATVRITAHGYAPDDLAVKVGTTVTWVNEDNVTRTVSADEQHDQSTGLEPEDREALRRSNTNTADDDGATAEAAETPSVGVGGAAALLAAVALALRRKR